MIGMETEDMMLQIVIWIIIWQIHIRHRVYLRIGGY